MIQYFELCQRNMNRSFIKIFLLCILFKLMLFKKTYLSVEFLNGDFKANPKYLADLNYTVERKFSPLEEIRLLMVSGSFYFKKDFDCAGRSLLKLWPKVDEQYLTQPLHNLNLTVEEIFSDFFRDSFFGGALRFLEQCANINLTCPVQEGRISFHDCYSRITWDKPFISDTWNFSVEVTDVDGEAALSYWHEMKILDTNIRRGKRPSTIQKRRRKQYNIPD